MRLRIDDSSNVTGSSGSLEETLSKLTHDANW